MRYLDSEKDFQLESLLNENEALRGKLEEQKNIVKRLEEDVVKYINEKNRYRVGWSQFQQKKSLVRFGQRQRIKVQGG